MNCIISYYFTSSFDPQGREPIKKSDPDYIMAWYKSVMKHGLKCILFHDGLTPELMEVFPGIRFIQVPPVPSGVQLHDYHWVVSHEYLRRHDDISNLFFTDCPDCEVINNPFIQPGYDPEKLYCGDEPELICDSRWMQCATPNTVMTQLEGFEEIFSAKAPLYNGGVLGGGRDKVLEFTKAISELVENVKFRPVDGTGDMALYNYILHRCFNPVHGFPVNSIFKGYENRTDIWFKHK
jgi:hypothetical protein